ncbi:hypothetical protein TTHERM_000317189 (macronuclear) [Tetrahymena thermophila SB210]|uniref:Uncharacterized protein n=1 Tax=Tetrahymena thermophila (strain SB210) TaxID=312017 RepID=W7XI82_TETTS|nr:hypothetical protein TTHERM_000317189 [Tetrahymena thermophila SB210]EWS73084.1 hypothetical protein TTHERM_000317189 [Tetrahymena thermophila SB210]|eukprot:XP_012654393.1 hypothetical protein TTHERM_000317189 [Tetrahymena thermophila SB210]
MYACYSAESKDYSYREYLEVFKCFKQIQLARFQLSIKLLFHQIRFLSLKSSIQQQGQSESDYIRSIACINRKSRNAKLSIKINTPSHQLLINIKDFHTFDQINSAGFSRLGNVLSYLQDIKKITTFHIQIEKLLFLIQVDQKLGFDDEINIVICNASSNLVLPEKVI